MRGFGRVVENDVGWHHTPADRGESRSETATPVRRSKRATGRPLSAIEFEGRLFAVATMGWRVRTRVRYRIALRATDAVSATVCRCKQAIDAELGDAADPESV
ncbi:hypothetical protein C481_05865 [Natrialba asiatica DSM 12278]|uniref:Uncharacterized protein n=1 Tax=Natrialba asiatica (strain ATCC 700177 / DSM 12278 / JCM 9576 / FERM P-10747 / NBRC 102637 / 172P1) TaxID=29540 RepID=M0AXW1_NATA1|nr:hypothetical protein C481_05865 [Natrialba asiatica DSM 12278]